MAGIRTSQVVIEVIRTGDPAARVSQDAVEVIRTGDPAARVSQTAIEVIWGATVIYDIDEDFTPHSIVGGKGVNRYFYVHYQNAALPQDNTIYAKYSWPEVSSAPRMR